MYEEFFSKRLAQLRMAKGVSAREMSTAIGQSVNYINNLENRVAYPSMTAFYYICEYFNITPKEFFDDEVKDPEALREVIEDLKYLDEEAFKNVAGIIKGLRKRNE